MKRGVRQWSTGETHIWSCSMKFASIAARASASLLKSSENPLMGGVPAAVWVPANTTTGFLDGVMKSSENPLMGGGYPSGGLGAASTAEKASKLSPAAGVHFRHRCQQQGAAKQGEGQYKTHDHALAAGHLSQRASHA